MSRINTTKTNLNKNKIAIQQYIEDQIKTRLQEIESKSKNSNQDLEYINITNEFINNIKKSKELYSQLTDVLSTVNNLEFQKFILNEINTYNNIESYGIKNYSSIFKYIIKQVFSEVPISRNSNNANKNIKLLLNNNSNVNYNQFSPNQMKAILKALDNPPLFYNYKSNNSLKLKTNDPADFIENLLELYKESIQIDFNIDNLFSKIIKNKIRVECPNSSNLRNTNTNNTSKSKSLIKAIDKTNKIITNYYKQQFKLNVCK